MKDERKMVVFFEMLRPSSEHTVSCDLNLSASIMAPMITITGRQKRPCTRLHTRVTTGVQLNPEQHDQRKDNRQQKI